jgi:4-hydroxythreonine-4-phosphate dehydrogenase
MKEKRKIKVGISIGDLNGIGCEVVLKAFEDSRMLDFCTPLIFASNKTISQQKNELKIDITYHGIQEASTALDGKVNVVNIWRDTPQLKYGEATMEAGDLAIRSLKATVEALKKDDIDVLVTAPIKK